VQLTCFRIVQESLSNARRHAPGCTARVQVSTGASNVEVTVSNTIASPTSGHDDSSGQGFGIPGMRERTALFGGTLEAGPNELADGRGWVVRAQLPVDGKISRPDGVTA
jgi:signal transduction histidine kinase